MFVDNMDDFGHLVNADNFDTSHVNNELYQLFDNKWDFEQRYIHPNYTMQFNANHTNLQVLFINEKNSANYFFVRTAVS
jgi:hypothetical protein